MAVLDESTESFIVDVPYVEEIEAQLRDEERKRTGRYLAVTAVLLIIGIGLYHTVPKITTKLTALVCAPVILLLYLLWLWYASQKRKHLLKNIDLNVENHAKIVLENLNNIKKGPQENLVYSSSEDETVKMKNENVKNYLEKHKLVKSNIDLEIRQENSSRLVKSNINLKTTQDQEQFSRRSSENGEILIRTYSIA